MTVSDADQRSSYSYLCIGCPFGCRLELDESADGDIVEVRGFHCKRGEEFAVQEHTDPRRVLTTTVAIDGAAWPRLPVKTAGSIPKALVVEACETLRHVHVHAPVTVGVVIAADIAGTGVDVVATRTMLPSEGWAGAPGGDDVPPAQRHEAARSVLEMLDDDRG